MLTIRNFRSILISSSGNDLTIRLESRWLSLQWTLEAMRVTKGLTQTELAEKFGVSSQTIARLEKDSSDIGYQLLNKYLKFFNVKFDDIFLGKKYENFVNVDKGSAE